MKKLLLLLALLLTAGNAANIATVWATENLRLIKATQPLLTPVNVARALFIVDSCIFDALAPFTPNWTPTMMNGIPRTPAAQWTEANRNKSISFAAYRALNNLFYGYAALQQTTSLFMSMGYNPNNTREDTTTPSGIGNLACNTILRMRVHDGANQLGDEPGTLLGGANYSDYTNYTPVNDAEPAPSHTDCNALRDINRWQPLEVPKKTGGTNIQTYVFPYATTVVPFAINSPSEFVSKNQPPLYGTMSHDLFISNMTEILQLSSMLDDRLKTIAEYWADYTGSVNPPGHWQQFAVNLCNDRNLNLLDSVTLLLLQAGATFDSGLTVWTVKRYYDSVRPITAIQCLWQNVPVTAWRAPYMGVGLISGSNWVPYQDIYFVTPPFAEFPSGHSGFSGSSAEVFKRFFGSDNWGGSAVIPAGSSLFEPKIMYGQPGFINGVTDVPNTGPNSIGYSPASAVILKWNTFSDAAAEAGMSRRYGGIHTEAGDLEGRRIGRAVGGAVWDKVQSLIGAAEKQL